MNERRAQLRERRKQLREKILFAREEDGLEVAIQRIRLKREHVDKVFGEPVEYVEANTGDIVFPDDFMWQCLPPPQKYFVKHRERMQLPPDEKGDPWYIGETAVIIKGVPFDLKEHELRSWIMKGVELQDKRLQKALTKLERVSEELRKNQERIDCVPFLKVASVSEEGAREERRQILEKLKEESQRIQKRYDRAEKKVSKQKRHRKFNVVELEHARGNEKQKVAVWYAKFATQKEEDSAIEMDEWSLIRLFRDSRKPVALHVSEVEAEENLHFLDDPTCEVNMRGVTLHRMRHGKGDYTDWRKGCAYRGDFVEGEWDGSGILYNREGIYRGSFQHGIKNRSGLLHFANGDIYAGEFLEGAPHDESGELKFADGSEYKGSVKHGRISGFGTFHKSRVGVTQSGTFFDGILNGQGQVIRESGEMFEGDFECGVLHGFGKWASGKGDFIEGYWQHGKPSGFCQVQHRKGPRYEGFYKDCCKWGHGIFRYGEKHERFDRSIGRKVVHHDHEYQGTWFAGKIMSGNCHVTYHNKFLPHERQNAIEKGHAVEVRQEMYFTTPKSWSRYPFLMGIVDYDEKKPLKLFKREEIEQEREADILQAISKGNKENFHKTRKDSIKLFKCIDEILAGFQESVQYGSDVSISAEEETEEQEEEEGINDEEDQDSNDEEEEEDDDDGESVPSDGKSSKEDDELSFHYEDSDWFSEDGDSDETEFHWTEFEEILRSSPFFRNLQVSLIDIFENPPPKPPHKSNNHRIEIEEALQHYLDSSRMNLVQKMFMS